MLVLNESGNFLHIGNLYNIPYVAYMQETIPKEAHRRAFSVMNSLMSAAMPLGLVIAGAVAGINGVASWLFITGVAFFIITGMSFFYKKITKFKNVNVISKHFIL